MIRSRSREENACHSCVALPVPCSPPCSSSAGSTSSSTPVRRPRPRRPCSTRRRQALGLPDDPELLVRANGVAMVGGGALLATGHVPRIASTVLAGTLMPTTLAAHPFWTETDPQVRAQQKIQFLKNLGLLGGLLLAAVDTDGRPAWPTARSRVGDSAQRHRPARTPARGPARGQGGPPRGTTEGGPGHRCPHLTGRTPRPLDGPVDAAVALPGQQVADQPLPRPRRARRAASRGCGRPLRSRDTLLMAQALRVARASVSRTSTATGLARHPRATPSGDVDDRLRPRRHGHALRPARSPRWRAVRCASTATRTPGRGRWARPSRRCAPSASASTTTAAARCRSPSAAPGRSAAATVDARRLGVLAVRLGAAARRRRTTTRA